MSYDIYGNPLQRGHCEVHPHVHEEYPCSVCMQENNNRNAQQQSESEHYETMRLEHELELSQQRIAELEMQVRAIALSRDELAATVERLREDLKSILGWRELRNTSAIPIERIEEVARIAIELNPQQNLNAMKREVLLVLARDLATTGEIEANAIECIEIYANTKYPSDKDDNP